MQNVDQKGMLMITAKNIVEEKLAATINITWQHIDNKRGWCSFCRSAQPTEIKVYKKEEVVAVLSNKEDTDKDDP